MKTFDPVSVPVRRHDKKETHPFQPTIDKGERLSISDLKPIRSSIQRMTDARNQPEIKQLLSEIWHSNELHILFADTGVGKSICAVSVSDALSKGDSFLFLKNDCAPQVVLYYDFELSDRQFRKRYTNEYGDEYSFSERFYIDTIDFEKFLEINPVAHFSELLFKKICYDIETIKPTVIVIDNLTYLNSQSTQDTQIALEVMRELNQLKKKFNLSILVLAHTPKRSMTSPITMNDLAGSKHLANFADSVSAIGKSALESDMRYIKQIKPSRSSEMVYDTNNVISCRIVKPDNFLTFELIDFGNEYDHLQQTDTSEKTQRRKELIERAIEMKNAGISLSQIALELLGSEKSKGTISKWLKEKE